MVFLASNGYRCIAHDRGGHGRSNQPWSGNEMDTYADDLAELIETLDLKGAFLINFSVPGLLGCWSQGATEAEALANIRDAIHDYLVVRDELIQGAEVREVEVA